MDGNDLLLDANKRVLAYGRSGAGKTGLVGKVLEVPEMCPLYVFDFDLRINSILAVVPKAALTGLSYDRFRDGAQAGKAFTDAEAKLRELGACIARGEGPRTVALDSITFAEKSLMSRVLMLDGKAPTFPPQLNHYKSVIAQLEDFVSKLCALNCNVIVTAHEDVDKDEITGSMVRGISVTGKKLPSVLPGYFDSLFYVEVQANQGKEPTHVVRVRPTPVIAARSVYSKDLDTTVPTDEIWKQIARIDAERKGGNQ